MKTNNPLKTALARTLAVVLSCSIAAEPVFAGTVTISSTPLATAGGSSVLPNLMFILDASGSMDSDYNGDYVNDNGKCMTRSTASNNCARGDPPYDVGGANGFNGVAYDPMLNYKPGLTSTGSTVVASPLTTTAVPNDAYGVQFSGTINITSGITDARFCNGNGLCKRNGADTAGVLVSGTDDLGRTMSAGRTPYRTTAANASNTIFGLPENMSQGSFARATTVVTVTTIHTHGLTTSDFVYPTGTGQAGMDLNTCVAVTAATANTFTYTSGSSGTISARTGSFRKCVSATFVRAGGSSTAQVASTAHGLATGDLITTANSAGSSMNVSNVAITVVDADNFTYSTGSTTASPSATSQWVRTGLYNQRGTATGGPVTWYITPIEYCSDATLTNCVEVIPPATAPAGFTFPAYVRFCQTAEQAYSTGLVSDASGTPRCRSKWVGSGSTQWTFPRLGWLNRDSVVATTATYTRSAARTDCAAAPTCTYAEELQNYGRWWAYYRTRMQMMKTAAGRAFLPFISNPSASPSIPDKIRVGFITINPYYAVGSGTNTGTVQSSRYLKIAPFNTTQASSWYTKFYAQDPNQSTPLREALSRVGWIYAGKLNTGLTTGIPAADDPVQQACQRNFTILTTDGYWNGNAGQDLTGGAIGNLDNTNPITDAPYTQVMVDRASTVTFDGGYPTIVTTAQPKQLTEQVVCVSNNATTFSGGTQTTCSCSAGQHMIKQRRTTYTETTTTANGVVTGVSNGPATYTFSNITACSAALIVTDTTPITNLQQVVCSGATNSTFSAGTQQACGCTNVPLTNKILQQTRSQTHTHVTTDGVVTQDTYSAFTDTFQAVTVGGTSGCQSLQVTTVQPRRDTQQALCQGVATNTTFATASNGVATQTPCGCSTAIQKAIKQRQVDYNNTVVTNDGAAYTNTNNAGTTTFTTPVACNSLIIVTHQPKRDQQEVFCQGTNAIAWSAAGNGTNPALSCQCSASASDKMILRRIIDWEAQTSTEDGTALAPVNTAGTMSFAATVACNHNTLIQDQPKRDIQQQLCQSNNAVGWTASPTSGVPNPASLCGCTSDPGAPSLPLLASQKSIVQRQIDYVMRTTTIDGVAGAPTLQGAPVVTFSRPTACNYRRNTTLRTGATITETIQCTGSAPSNFSDGTATGCGCNSSRHTLIHESWTNVNIQTDTIDGVAQPTTYTGGTRTLTYSNSTGGPFTGTVITGGSCTNTNLSAGATSQNITGGVTTNPNNGGATVTAANITQSPNPNLAFNVGGPVTVSNTGSTVTAGMIVLSPNPVSANNGASFQTNNGGTTITTAMFTVGSPGTAVVVNNGSATVTNNGQVTVSAASMTLTPNPQSNTGTTTSTTTGSSLAGSLQSPNPSATTNNGGSTVTTTPSPSQDTLADVAMYYYRTDLRGGVDLRGNATGPALNASSTDVSQNVVPAKAGAKDFVTHQHMVTFSVGLADGFMRYQADYETSASGDFANIKNGTNNGCFWVSGVCNWPLPVADDPSALDDLWHAAVNGRGQYYQATNADALSTGIQTALTAVNAQVAAAAASATSSPNVTQTDNQIFSTTYETNTWSGKVFAQTIDPATGNVDPTIQWQADTQLLAKVGTASDSRTLWMYDSSAASKLKPFAWGTLTGDGLSASERLWFTNKCVPLSTMTQCSALNAAQLITANDGQSLVGFLRGWSGNEGTVFRDRTYIDLANNSAVVQTVLGDTISAKPAFLRNPTFNYADAVTPSYATFATANVLRSPNVYVGANDGFLHAFNANTGDERWAYAPRFLMPALYQLADTGYPTLHRYYADGSPETGDVFDSGAGQWKTILVAGVAGGGRGYYAIDVTDPLNPKGLWEVCNDSTLCAINDSDIGLTYGNPVIGKRKVDGKWVVVVTSGLNNVSPGTTGRGFFYVLDALTGAILSKVDTGAGSLATPSGLMKISAYYDSALTDATFQYVYGGDQLGNVWRLDTSTATPSVLQLTQLMDASTPTPRAQPITTRPALTHIGTSRILYIGTGRYLGTPDLSDPGAASGIAWQQTLYAFKDKDVHYGAAGTSLRASANLVQQSLTSVSPTERGVTTNAVDWNTKDGWYVDFNPTFSGVQNSPGEGINLVDPRLALGTLVATTNVPASGGASCSVGGSSFDYNFDFKTGQAVSTSAGGVVGRSLGATITVGVAIVQLPSGAIKSISTGADTSKTTSSVNTSTAGASVKRFSYRVR